MDRPVSVKDVAAAAGVSVGSVSNVLNRPDEVGPETRRAVEVAIAALGYVPNEAARRLRGMRSTPGCDTGGRASTAPRHAAHLDAEHPPDEADPLDLAILEGLAAGGTTLSLASDLCTPVSLVRRRIGALHRSLDAVTPAQLVAIALRRGIIR